MKFLLLLLSLLATENALADNGKVSTHSKASAELSLTIPPLVNSETVFSPHTQDGAIIVSSNSDLDEPLMSLESFGVNNQGAFELLDKTHEEKMPYAVFAESIHGKMRLQPGKKFSFTAQTNDDRIKQKLHIELPKFASSAGAWVGVLVLVLTPE